LDFEPSIILQNLSRGSRSACDGGDRAVVFRWFQQEGRWPSGRVGPGLAAHRIDWPCGDEGCGRWGSRCHFRQSNAAIDDSADGQQQYSFAANGTANAFACVGDSDNGSSSIIAGDTHLIHLTGFRNRFRLAKSKA
jgi:hypothetical protein